jgi:transposase-like protein
MAKEVEVISAKTKQRFSPRERERIVSESYQSNLSLSQFAKKMGISAPTLCQWRKKFPLNDTFQAQDYDFRSENEDLKKEIFELKALLGQMFYELERYKLYDNESLRRYR